MDKILFMVICFAFSSVVSVGLIN